MISERGIELIKSFEGFSLTAYPDPATGGEPYTIGIGHTGGVTPGQVCTEEEAIEWLKEDCAEAEEAINDYVDVELTQNQIDALVSLIFNIGVGNFRNSTLLKLLNAEGYNNAAKQFGKWVKAAGKTMPGLVRRRKAEAELFMEA